LPALSDDSDKDLPATLNQRVLTGLLRDELHYDGLVITDASRCRHRGPLRRRRSAVRAVIAGADVVMVLWYPEKKHEVRKALKDAIESGRIPEWRLNQAVRRVLLAKARRGLFTHDLRR